MSGTHFTNGSTEESVGKLLSQRNHDMSCGIAPATAGSRVQHANHFATPTVSLEPKLNPSQQAGQSSLTTLLEIRITCIYDETPISLNMELDWLGLISYLQIRTNFSSVLKRNYSRGHNYTMVYDMRILKQHSYCKWLNNDFPEKSYDVTVTYARTPLYTCEPGKVKPQQVLSS